MSDSEYLWRNFSEQGFPFVKKWWKINFWRAAFQPQKYQDTLGYCLVNAVQMQTFQKIKHEQYEQMIEFCVKRSSSACKMEALKIIAETNATPLLKYFAPHLNNLPLAKVLNTAAERQHWSVVQALQSHDAPQNPINVTLELAAKCGNFEVVKMLEDHATSNQIGKALGAASDMGHLEVVKHLVSRCDNRDILPALVNALQRDRNNIVELLTPLLSVAELEIAKVEARKGIELDFSVKNRYPAQSTIDIVDRYILRNTLQQETANHSPAAAPKRKM